MSLSDCKSVILTTSGEDLPLNHTFRGIVDRTMENILRCEALLNNYADNTFQSPSNDRDRRARVREIRKYLKTYPPTINLLSFEPDHYAETQVKQAQKTPTNNRTYWNLSNHPDRQSSVCHIAVNKGIVDALNESKDNNDTGIFRMLSALIIITLVHEIAHVIHATFAEMPTPLRIGGFRVIPEEKAYVDSTRSATYVVGEAGDSAENVISGNKGEFWAYYGTPGDYKTIETLQIRGAYKEDARGSGRPIQRQVTCAINAVDQVLNDLIEGNWDPAPTFPNQTLPPLRVGSESPNQRAKKISPYHVVQLSGPSSSSIQARAETPETPTQYEKASGSIIRDGKYYRI